MSEWFEVKDADDVELSDDGKFVYILFDTDNSGNRYVEVPVEMLVKLLDKNAQVEDGFGQSVSAICPTCYRHTMQVVRPGMFQCSNCADKCPTCGGDGYVTNALDGQESCPVCHGRSFAT